MYWIKFFSTTGYLNHAYTITEIGAGNSNRIQKILKLLSFRGSYTSVDCSDVRPSSLANVRFSTNIVKKDYFQYRGQSDLLIFDHSFDDLLAAMLSDGDQNYSELMNNIRLFDYQDPQFVNKINKIFTTAKTLITPNARIIISNYLTKYDRLRKTTNITRQLLPQLSQIADSHNLQTDYFSNRFLVLKKVR